MEPYKQTNPEYIHQYINFNKIVQLHPFLALFFNNSKYFRLKDKIAKEISSFLFYLPKSFTVAIVLPYSGLVNKKKLGDATFFYVVEAVYLVRRLLSSRTETAQM